jgi:hypothetical protein
VDWGKRVPFFKHILEITGARSVLEFGCGPGWNLSACKRAYNDVETYGIEINDGAANMAINADLWITDEMALGPVSELVFTTGCLIHIPSEDISDIMQQLIDKSYRYIMSIEYEAPEEKEIEYRGQSGLLWKRPYIEMYESMGLTLLERGKLQDDVGFDNCTYGLFVK